MAYTQAHLTAITAQLQGLVLQMQAISVQPTVGTPLTPATSIASSEVHSKLEHKINAIIFDLLSLERDMAGI